MPTCSGARFSWCPFSLKAHLPQCPSVPKYPFAPKCPFDPIADLPWNSHFFWCGFAPNTHFPPILTCPNVHRSQGAYYSTPKCSFAANICLPWCSFFLVLIFPKCPFAPEVHLFLCPSASKTLVCPIKCPKYPFAPMSRCPYNCAQSYPT